MKVAKLKELSVNDDPRPTDRVVFNRLKLMVEHEACHPAWGCALYRLHRLDEIDGDQREAGDQYWRLVEDHKRWQATDPDELIPEARELAYARIDRIKYKYQEVRNLLGIGRKWIDALIFDEYYPSFQRDKLIVKQGLRLLANYFFISGTKREPR